mgnify:CR=1 FL=1
MVRLEEISFFLKKPIDFLFQFHYGTIRRLFCFSDIGLASNFNSTMVRLEGSRAVACVCRSRYFNSTMVRLEAVSVEITPLPRTYFNSTMVRLEATDDFKDVDELDMISIPLWYD